MLVPLLVLLFIVEASFGGFAVVNKYVFTDEATHVEALTFCFLRNILAAPLLLGASYYLFEPWHRPAYPTRYRDWLAFASLGLTFTYANQYFNSLGVKMTTPFNGAIVQQMVPLLTMAISVYLGHESLDPRLKTNRLKICGLMLAVTGAVYLLLGKHQNPSDTRGRFVLLGNCLLMLNATAFAISLFIQKHLLKRYPPMFVVAWSFIFGAGFFLIGIISALGVADNLSSNILWNNFGYSGPWWALGYAVIVCSLIDYPILSLCNKKLGALMITSFIPLQPVSAALLSWLFLDYGLETRDVYCALLTIGGLFCVVYSKWKEQSQCNIESKLKEGNRSEGSINSLAEV